MALKDTFKNAGDNGTLLALGAVALTAVAGELSQRGMIPALPTFGLGGANTHGGGGSFNDDDYYAFGQEYEDFGSSNRGSRARGSRASGYQQFVSEHLPHLVAQGYTPKEAMKKVAEQWRAL